MKNISQAIVATELAVMFAGSTLLTPLYDIYRRTLGFSELTLTLIYAVYAVGNLGALLLLGRLSDQIGRRWTSLRAIAGAGASALIFLCAPGIGALFVARVLSGLAIGLASGTATAWIAELDAERNKTRASVIATSANFAGLATGPLLAGLLAQYAPAPLRLSFGVYFVIVVLTDIWVAKAHETVEQPVRRLRDASLRPRIGVPRKIWRQFFAPAVTAFATFAVVGFFASLVPGVFRREWHESNVAAGAAVVSIMFVAGFAGIWATRNLASRIAMLGSMSILFVSLALLGWAESLHRISVLLGATVLVGFSSAVAYRGSLQVVNQIAPPERRAEVISSYLVTGFLGNSLPVIGIGIVSKYSTPAMANTSFTIMIACLILVALATGIKFTAAPTPEERPEFRRATHGE